MSTVVVRAIPRLRLVVWLHTAEAPGQHWEPALAIARAASEEIGDPMRLRMLAVSDGGAPNAAQRKAVADTVFRAEPVRMSAVSNAFDSPVLRGIVTALRWVNPGLLAVSPDRWREALEHIQVEHDVETVVGTLDSMQAELPAVRSLAELKRAIG